MMHVIFRHPVVCVLATLLAVAGFVLFPAGCSSPDKANIIVRKQNQQAMRYMEQNRLAYDAQGRPMLYPLPPQYYDYDRAQRRLEVQRQESVALLDALRAKAQAVKQQLPMPKYTGAQLMIGVEGTPAIVPSESKPTPPPVTETPNVNDDVATGSNNSNGGGAAPPPATPPQNPLDAPKPNSPTAPKTPPAGDPPLKY